MSTTVEEKAPIKFFGSIDLKADGITPASQVPAWMMELQCDLMQEAIDQKQRALDSGSVERENEGEYRVLIERETKRLREIKESRPVFNDSQKDQCAKAYKELRTGIRDALPSRDDEKFGHVRPHEEYKRNVKGCIKITAGTIEIAQANGIRVDDKQQISRNDATRLQSFIGAAIGEDGNVERLRKIK